MEDSAPPGHSGHRPLCHLNRCFQAHFCRNEKNWGVFHWQSNDLAWRWHATPLVTTTDKSHGLLNDQEAKLYSLHVPERRGCLTLCDIRSFHHSTQNQRIWNEDYGRSQIFSCCAWGTNAEQRVSLCSAAADLTLSPSGGCFRSKSPGLHKPLSTSGNLSHRSLYMKAAFFFL